MSPVPSSPRLQLCSAHLRISRTAQTRFQHPLDHRILQPAQKNRGGKCHAVLARNCAISVYRLANAPSRRVIKVDLSVASMPIIGCSRMRMPRFGTMTPLERRSPHKSRGRECALEQFTRRCLSRHFKTLLPPSPSSFRSIRLFFTRRFAQLRDHSNIKYPLP